MISPIANSLELDQKMAALDLHERLQLIAQETVKPVFTTSLGIEDQLITHFIATHKIAIKIVTLQTGRLFPQTLQLLEKTKSHYGIEIDEFHPKNLKLKEYIQQHGLNGFYDSIQARHDCCNIRKLEPLARALEGSDAWITGLRRAQSNTRNTVTFCEQQDGKTQLKFNPLADLERHELLRLVDDFDIPINPLHASGYPSIGCEPCTRALKPGEDERVGRWWWENEQARECGLHTAKDER